MNKDLEREVIGMLTAWAQAVQEMPAGTRYPDDIPADLLAALAAPLRLDDAVNVKIPAGLVPAQREILCLAQDIRKQIEGAALAHYGQVIGFLMRLLTALGREAAPRVDVAEFLQRQALQLAADGSDPDEGLPHR